MSRFSLNDVLRAPTKSAVLDPGDEVSTESGSDLTQPGKAKIRHGTQNISFEPALPLR